MEDTSSSYQYPITRRTLPSPQIWPLQLLKRLKSTWYPFLSYTRARRLRYIAHRYKSALRAFYAKHFCVPVFFEVGRISGKGGHAHVQVVPLPNKLKDKVENAFITEGRSQGIDFEEDAEGAMEACQGGRGGYFRVDLPDGRKMVHLIKDHVPFGIQFGRSVTFSFFSNAGRTSCLTTASLPCSSRQVLVNLLNAPERLDWKACALSEDEDRADSAAFKTAFAPFDPSG